MLNWFIVGLGALCGVALGVFLFFIIDSKL